MIHNKVYIETLGCSKNEIDSELMMSLLENSNYTAADTPEEANIIVVNTCGFIDKAKEESIETIWEMTKYKARGQCNHLILAGCLAERYSKELLDEIDDVDAVIGTGNIRDLPSIIENLNENKNRIKKTGKINTEYLEDINRIYFSPTEYVRISEGCDNLCTYCIIPKLRGRHRSRKIEDILHEVEYLVKNGVREIILIGQNTSDYGIDIYGEYTLHILLDKLNEVENLKWIRLLYLYPDNFSDKLIASIKNNDKVVKYVDIPLQHISDNILKKMNRKTSKTGIENLINTLRREIPDIIIRTTFIVGFPGETENDFNELLDFIEEYKLDKLGVFTYSREEGTPAYNLPNQISEKVKLNRKDKIMETQLNISTDKMKEKLHKEFIVLIEEYHGNNTYIGRTYMDSPDIDGILYLESEEFINIGDFVKVKIIDYLEYDLIGEVIK